LIDGIIVDAIAVATIFLINLNEDDELLINEDDELLINEDDELLINEDDELTTIIIAIKIIIFIIYYIFP